MNGTFTVKVWWYWVLSTAKSCVPFGGLHVMTGPPPPLAALPFGGKITNCQLCDEKKLPLTKANTVMPKVPTNVGSPLTVPCGEMVRLGGKPDDVYVAPG